MGANVSSYDDDDVDDANSMTKMQPILSPPDVSPLPPYTLIPSKVTQSAVSELNGPADQDTGGPSPNHSPSDGIILGGYISHTVRMDSEDVIRAERHGDPEHVGLINIPTTTPDPSQPRHQTSYNAGSDRDPYVDNSGDLQMRVIKSGNVNSSQEEKLKNIHAQIAQINCSMTPATRDLLAPDKLFDVSSSDVSIDSQVAISESSSYMEPIIISKAIIDLEPFVSRNTQSELILTTSFSSDSIHHVENDAESIPNRQDMQDKNTFTIKGEIDSDNYHHVRRYSEVEDHLEFIRGRDDWHLYQNLQSRRLVDQTDLYKISIRDQIDSDEYHHAWRVCEGLDLAQSNCRLLDNPTKALPYDDRNFFRTSDNEFGRSVSESRFIDSERMYTDEHTSWSVQSTSLDENHNISNHPSPIHILIEDISKFPDVTGNIDQTEKWSELSEFETPIVQRPTGWLLEQSIDINTLESNTARRPSIPHQNTLDDSYVVDYPSTSSKSVHVVPSLADRQADQEVADIFDSSSMIASQTAQPLAVSAICKRTEPIEFDCVNANTVCEDENRSKLKKSKTTRNLLDVERLSVDLSSNEPALKAIAEKSNEMKLLKCINESSVRREAANANEILKPMEQPSSSSNNAISMQIVTIETLPVSPFMPLTPLTRRTPTMDELVQETSIGPWFRKTPQENVDDLLQETSMGPWFHN